MRSGTVAVIGKANAGKSTLVNVLVGEKIAIVSPKPQTTRDRIMGVLTREAYQIAFVDTPGIYRHRNALSDVMMKTTKDTARDVDAILFVHDGHAGLKEDDIALMKSYASLGVPMIVAYTKIDIMPKENIPADVKTLFEAGVTADVYPVSARKGQNLKKLEEGIAAMLPEGGRIFGDEVVSDRSEKFMVAELMREKILLKYDEEIPHGVAVVVHTFRRRENGTYEIGLDIVCEKQAHKAIVIGKGGEMLKKIGANARYEIERMLEMKVNLKLWVKVKKDWRDSDYLLKNYGYDKKEV